MPFNRTLRLMAERRLAIARKEDEEIDGRAVSGAGKTSLPANPIETHTLPEPSLFPGPGVFPS